MSEPNAGSIIWQLAKEIVDDVKTLPDPKGGHGAALDMVNTIALKISQRLNETGFVRIEKLGD
jgi:hypothetical protein